MDHLAKLQRLVRPDRLRKAAPGLLALAAAIVAIAAFHAMFTAGVISQAQTMSDRISRQQQLIDKYEQKIRGAGNVEKSLDKLRKESELAEYLSNDISETTITTEIDGMFADLSEKGLEKVAFQPLAQTSYQDFREVNIKTVFRGDIHGLYELFKSLEEYGRPLRIKQLTVKASSRRRGGAPPLTIMITLSTLTGLIQDG